MPADASPLAADIQAYEAAYATFFQRAAAYPAHLQHIAGVCGVWSAHDVLAHLSGWTVEAKRRYQRYAEGTGDMQYNVDAYNQISVWQRRERSYAEVLAELRTLVAELAALASEVTEAQLQRDDRYRYWLIELTREAHEHGSELQTFLEAQS